MQGAGFWKVWLASLAVILPQMCSGRQGIHSVGMLATGWSQMTLYVRSSTASTWLIPATKLTYAAISFSMMKL